MNDSILTMPQRQPRALLPKLHIDLPLLTGLLLLCGFGLAVLYSAGGNDLGLVKRQLLHLGLAVVVMIGIAQIPPGRLKQAAPWVYLLGVALLVAVLFVGAIGK